MKKEELKDVVKLHQKKYRQLSGKFILEGYKVIESAYFSGIDIEKVFVLEENEKKYAFLKDKITSVAQADIERLSTTKSACDAVAVAKMVDFTLGDVQKLNKIALFEDIKDAGNLGTILRSAAAFGIDAIILAGNCVDLYNPKTVRSAVGTLLKIPVIELAEASGLKEYFPAHTLIATALNGKSLRDTPHFDRKSKILVMFGSEAEGLSENLLNQADEKITIDMMRGVESLNVAMSATIVFWACRQVIKG